MEVEDLLAKQSQGVEEAVKQSQEAGDFIRRQAEIPQAELVERSKAKYNPYTIIGEPIIRKLKEAKEWLDMPDMRDEIDNAMTLAEGLWFGKYGKSYSLDDDRVLGHLFDLFTTREGSMERPESSYLMLAAKDVLSSHASEHGEFLAEPNKWERKSKKSYRRQLLANNRQIELNGGTPLSTDQIDEKAARFTQEDAKKLEGLEERQPELIGILAHVKARLSYDTRYRYVQHGVRSDTTAAEIRDKLPQPDKEDWVAFYKNEWGDAVDSVERKIERIVSGKEDIVYRDEDGQEVRINGKKLIVDGINSGADFKAFLETLLHESRIGNENATRMDVVWAAWRMASIKGVFTKHAWYVNPEDGRYNFGDPPLGDDLMSKQMHSEKKRALEFGWGAYININETDYIMDLDEKKVLDANGNVLRVRLSDGTLADLDGNRNYEMYEHYLEQYIRSQKSTRHKAMSHSGHPMSIGRIGILNDEYMRNTVLKEWRSPDGRRHKDVSLYDIWMKHGISQANPNFPWFSTEIRGEEAEFNEMSAGSIGGWDLRAFRAHNIRGKFITELVPQQDLSFGHLKSSDFRTHQKLGLMRPGEFVNGRPTNPIVWEVAGWLVNNCEYLRPNSPYLQGDRGVRASENTDRAVGQKAGETWTVLSEFDVLTNLLNLNAISSVEKRWIEQNILAEPEWH